MGFKDQTGLQANEGTDATLTVTRVGRPTRQTRVDYVITPFGINPATPGVDYMDSSGALIFPPNVMEQDIVVTLLPDEVDEHRERFKVTLLPTSGAGADQVVVDNGRESRIVIIKDQYAIRNDPYRPTATLHAFPGEPIREPQSVLFTVRLDRVSGRNLHFNVSLASDPGTAGNGVDYLQVDTIPVTVLAGQTQEFVVYVNTIEDNLVEGPETFSLALAVDADLSLDRVHLGDPNLVTVTILGDEVTTPASLELSSTVATLAESAAERTITITATPLTEDGSTYMRAVDTTVRVDLAAAPGVDHPADEGDFQPFDAFDIVIPAGQSSGSGDFSFTVTDDSIDEEEETVTLRGVITADEYWPVGIPLPVATAAITITDDDTRGVTVSPATLAIGEGANAAYTIVLNSQPTDTVTIGVDSNDQAPHLEAVPASLTFSGRTWNVPQTVVVYAQDDGAARTAVREQSIVHSATGGDYGDFTVDDMRVVIENTTVSTIAVGDAWASESEDTIDFMVTVTPPLDGEAVTVDYLVEAGTAFADEDYQFTPARGQTTRTLTIPSGGSGAMISIPLVDRMLDEADEETFTLRLSNPTGAQFKGGGNAITATGTILDDDPAPVVTVEGPAGDISFVSEETDKSVTFTLKLKRTSGVVVSVEYETGALGPSIGFIGARSGFTQATEDVDYTPVIRHCGVPARRENQDCPGSPGRRRPERGNGVLRPDHPQSPQRPHNRALRRGRRGRGHGGQRQPRRHRVAHMAGSHGAGRRRDRCC